MVELFKASTLCLLGEIPNCDNQETSLEIQSPIVNAICLRRLKFVRERFFLASQNIKATAPCNRIETPTHDCVNNRLILDGRALRLLFREASISNRIC